MVSWRRRAFLMGLLVAVLASLAWGFLPEPVLVETAVAERKPLRVTVEQEGRTRVVDRYVLSAPVSGYMRRIGLDVGDTVAAGDALVQLEPGRAEPLDPRQRAGAEARVAAAQAALARAEQQAQAAEAGAELAAAELARVRALRERRFASTGEEDRAVSASRQAQADLRSAHFAVEVARHEIEASRTSLRFAGARSSDRVLTVRAPVAGRVLRLARESEGTVTVGAPLVELGDPSALEVEVDVLSADAVRLRPGTRVRFARWGGSQTLEGVVKTVEPVGFTKVSALGVEEQRVWVICDFTSNPALWRPLGDGYRVEASFVLWTGADVLQVPASALFRAGDGWAAFVVEGGHARQRRVEIGQRTGLQAQILSGIRPGERVITHPDDKVADGVRVEPR